MKLINKIIYSPELEREVELFLRIPENETGPYNVLYIHDGDSAFSDKYSKFYGGWDFHGTLSKLEQENEILPTICIAFSATKENDRFERMCEYSIWDNDFLLKERGFATKYQQIYKNGILKQKGTQHLNFIKYLIDNVEKEFVNNINRENRFLIGSSMGGLMSLVCLYKLNDEFSKAFCLSPAFWYSQTEMLKLIDDNNLINSEIYLDYGTKEGEENETTNIRYQKSIDQISSQLNLVKQKHDLVIWPFATHSPPAWRTRLYDVLKNRLN